MERTDLIHCFPNYIPGWREVGDTPDVAAFIAPRALHLNFGEKDTGSPIEEVHKAVEVIQKAYAARNAADNFSVLHRTGRRPRTQRRNGQPDEGALQETPRIAHGRCCYDSPRRSMGSPRSASFLEVWF